MAWNQRGVTGKNGTNGANGTSGTSGTNGANGASAGLNDFNNGPINISTSGEHTVATMPNVPAGNYILMAKVHIAFGGVGLSTAS